MVLKENILIVIDNSNNTNILEKFLYYDTKMVKKIWKTIYYE